MDPTTFWSWTRIIFDLGLFYPIVPPFPHFETGVSSFFLQMIIDYIYVPGTVLDAWDTPLNKANLSSYSLGNFIPACGDRSWVTNIISSIKYYARVEQGKECEETWWVECNDKYWSI